MIVTAGEEVICAYLHGEVVTNENNALEAQTKDVVSGI